MATDHDSGYKLLFSHPEMVRDLLTGFVQGAWLEEADFCTLTPVHGSYVTQTGDPQQRHDDLVWKIRLNDRWLYVYLLMEFQSATDPRMALRMMVYIGLLYQDQRSLRRSFAIWIMRFLRTKLPNAAIDGINDLQEVRSMLAENIKSWFEEHEAIGVQRGKVLGIQEGEVLGMQKGEALALQRLLSRRFGAIASDITDKIAAAPSEQILLWFDRAIDATALGEVFRDN